MIYIPIVFCPLTVHIANQLCELKQNGRNKEEKLDRISKAIGKDLKDFASEKKADDVNNAILLLPGISGD